mmetsp:Transcript_91927/g.259078  ORF Transcript_91927/g.259078 Transcript_91927/m.259078 type:complete len:318 (+) Transcript_91927:1903-2856(+)
MQLRCASVETVQDPGFAAMLAIVHGTEVHTQVAVALQTAQWQGRRPLSVVPLQGLTIQSHLLDELPPQLRGKHRIWNATRQRLREEGTRPHRERRKESCISNRSTNTFDDVKQLAALLRLVQDRCAREASQHYALGTKQEGPEVCELLPELSLCSHEVVHLVHENNLVRVHVRVFLAEANLEEGARWQAVIPQMCVPASGRGVPQRAQRCRRKRIIREAALEVVLPCLTHAAHVEATLHLENLTHLLADGLQLLVAQGADVPNVIAKSPPSDRTRGSGGAMRPKAAEVVAVLARPSQQFGIKVTTDRLFREDRHLGS